MLQVTELAGDRFERFELFEPSQTWSRESVGVEHTLDFICVVRFSTAPMTAASGLSRAANYRWRQSRAWSDPGCAPRGRRRRGSQRHMSMPVSLKHLSKAASSAGVGRPAPVPALTMPFGAGLRRGFNHRAVSPDVRNHDVDPRKGVQIAHVELGLPSCACARAGGKKRSCRRHRRNPTGQGHATGNASTR